MKPDDCTCREVLVDQVLQRVSHPYYMCRYYGTFTPIPADMESESNSAEVTDSNSSEQEL